MPLEKLEYHANTHVWGIWKITETEEELLSHVKDYESIAENITHPAKRLEFIAGRVLAKVLLEKTGGYFEGVTKDVFGKPFYKKRTYHLSLSHSYPLVGAILDTQKTVGIDVEQIKNKLLKIAPRVLHASELQDAADSETKHCIYWCAKEALVKVYGKKDLVFSENLRIEPFALENEGHLTGRIVIDDAETTLPLQYLVFGDFVVVFTV